MLDKNVDTGNLGGNTTDVTMAAVVIKSSMKLEITGEADIRKERRRCASELINAVYVRS